MYDIHIPMYVDMYMYMLRKKLSNLFSLAKAETACLWSLKLPQCHYEPHRAGARTWRLLFLFMTGFSFSLGIIIYYPKTNYIGTDLDSAFSVQVFAVGYRQLLSCLGSLPSREKEGRFWTLEQRSRSLDSASREVGVCVCVLVGGKNVVVSLGVAEVMLLIMPLPSEPPAGASFLTVLGG